MGEGGQCHALAALHPGRSPSTHCTGGCVGPRDSLDECGENKITCTHQEFKPQTIQPVASHYTMLCGPS
jgi:hypothetical protein